MYSSTQNTFIALLIELKQILEFVPMYPCTQNKFGCNFCLDWGQILKSKISVHMFIERNQNFIEFFSTWLDLKQDLSMFRHGLLYTVLMGQKGPLPILLKSWDYDTLANKSWAYPGIM